MRVGISLSNLAGNVAKYSAIGVISATHPGYLENDFEKNTLQANLRALKNNIKKAKEISNNGIIFDYNVNEIIKTVKQLESEYKKEIPVIVAGGIFDSDDIRKYMELGANGVKIGSRFVATYECDADIKFKEAYLDCSKDDIKIVKSPVGMPGRAINNDFLRKINTESDKINVIIV